jgi:hypothetical protein
LYHRPSPVQLSPEFLEGSTGAGLEKIRTRLLDLTNRNRLLNFRHTLTSSLRVVDADLNDVFLRLLEGEKLSFGEREIRREILPRVFDRTLEAPSFTWSGRK